MSQNSLDTHVSESSFKKVARCWSAKLFKRDSDTGAFKICRAAFC